jgi:hypothetical protein
MANLEWERSEDDPLPTTARLRSATAVDWITDHEEAAVERLFALLEQNQVAIAALAQAWRHTRRALAVTQAELAQTQSTLAAELRLRRRSSG